MLEIFQQMSQYGLRFKSFILESGYDFKRENSISTWRDSVRKIHFQVYHLRVSDCRQTGHRWGSHWELNKEDKHVGAEVL